MIYAIVPLFVILISLLYTKNRFISSQNKRKLTINKRHTNYLKKYFLQISKVEVKTTLRDKFYLFRKKFTHKKSSITE